jgi:hypothetical protein
MTHTQQLNKDLINYAIDQLVNVSTPYGCDLHNELFNTDYFIIGYYAAEQWLIANVGIFAAIEEVKQYEKDNFGEVSTDFSSSEKVVNMYAYIQGEQILWQSKTLQSKWDVRLTDKDIKKIASELKKLL